MKISYTLISLLLIALLGHTDSWLETDGGLHLTAKPFKEGYSGEAQRDKVDRLPGWGPTKFGLYSGYVTVDDEAGRALFYVFAESQANASSDPLVLWLNGGPGCSSLGGGLMSELGPFYPTPHSNKLKANEFSWNRVANMLFLESPAFVGFSYSNTSEDQVVGDWRTAQDATVFLAKWFARFPAYAGRPFWVAGESYGGHYVPNLAAAILEHNSDPSNTHINLQGFLVGNAWTDPAIDNKGAVDFWWSHAIISDDTKDGLMESCDFSRIGPLLQNTLLSPGALVIDGVRKVFQGIMDVMFPDTKNANCDNFIQHSASEMGPINIYGIYLDVCHAKRAGSEARQLAHSLRGTPTGLSTSSLLQEQQLDPCIDNEVEVYFNQPAVQAALHANTTALPWRWTDCSPLVQYNMSDLFTSMLPVYERLLKQKELRMLVFSGDVDGIVPVIGSRRWVASLKLPVIQAWRPWVSSTGQVGGYVEEYRGLTFATVRNAGHMVPYTQAERAFHMFSNWIANQAF